MRRLKVIDLGLREYGQVWDLQKDLLKKRISGEAMDTLILVEHPPVITLGRGASEEDILVSPEYLARRKIPLFRVERGGKATFHGPGQLVAYPIIALLKKDVHRYLRDLEETLIRLLARLGVEGRRKRGYTGVWVGEKKIASIGIGVKRWVSFHGLALNVNTDLSYFSLIFPCGMDGRQITSLKEVLSSPVQMAEVKELFVSSFCEVFDFQR
ncbi:lipoyl(octanoyl) transferase [Candidatus Aerophobetes bacterium]|uniref:Octanoyltransferase n=1 Tax=Aerophobetes bacterium TaxID=2030807 RepID=A0A497E6Y2_UNCAE|nr:MAG: lipoyl(octanoyl) transferase [Candidatus Aerophobetes bacterium]